MANEITAIEGIRDGGVVRWQLFMLFPVAPKMVGGSNVIPTPANVDADPANQSLLPKVVDRVITVGERSRLNAGTLVFEIASFVRLSGMTNAQLRARAQEIYATQKASVQSDLDARFEFSGARINEI